LLDLCECSHWIEEHNGPCKVRGPRGGMCRCTGFTQSTITERDHKMLRVFLNTPYPPGRQEFLENNMPDKGKTIYQATRKLHQMGLLSDRKSHYRRWSITELGKMVARSSDLEAMRQMIWTW
jgi:hypothetical protein